jgi:integrase
MSKRLLNDRIVKALKPAAAGKRTEIFDALVPGLAVRVTDKGAKSFVLVARYPGSANPTRRALGSYGELTLEQARVKARVWLELVQRGIDPAVQVERDRLAEQRKTATTFAAIAEDFIREKCSQERRGYESERIIRKELLPAWGGRSVADITPLDVVLLLKPIKARGKRRMATAVLATCKRLFGWAIDQHVYGLETSPCDRLKPRALVGELPPRQRVLDDRELVAFWRAAERMPYPHGPLLKLLALTACRHQELAGARWPEVDFGRKVLTIPPERFKSGAAHVVPLVGAAVEILEQLPRFQRSDFLFSASAGKHRSRVFHEIKLALDRRMLRSLQAMARVRGESPSAVELKSWVVHDLRRVVRSHLAALRIPDAVAEMCLGHGKRGLQRIYNQHGYQAEVREAMTLWAGRLRSIVEPPPANVVPLARAR